MTTRQRWTDEQIQDSVQRQYSERGLAGPSAAPADRLTYKDAASIVAKHSDDAAMEQLCAFLASSPQKLDDAFVNADWDDNYALSSALGLVWLKAQDASEYGNVSGFVSDMQSAASKRGLTVAQVRGTLNLMRASVIRRGDYAPFDDAPEAKIEMRQPGALDLSSLPDGRYGVPGDDDSRLKVRIQKPTDGKWNGWIFVSDAAEYGQGQRYGSQRPGSMYSGKIADMLRAIVNDPHAAMVKYGKITGTCGRCGRALEDATSVANGIGPICASKLGW